MRPLVVVCCRPGPDPYTLSLFRRCSTRNLRGLGWPIVSIMFSAARCASMSVPSARDGCDEPCCRGPPGRAATVARTWTVHAVIAYSTKATSIIRARAGSGRLPVIIRRKSSAWPSLGSGRSTRCPFRIRSYVATTVASCAVSRNAFEGSRHAWSRPAPSRNRSCTRPRCGARPSAARVPAWNGGSFRTERRKGPRGARSTLAFSSSGAVRKVPLQEKEDRLLERRMLREVADVVSAV